MIQYTTPVIGVRFRGMTLVPTQVAEAKLTLQPVDKARRPNGDPVDYIPQVTVDGGDTLVSLKLTQQQSGALPLGPYKAMVNIKMKDGSRHANVPVYGQVTENLHAQVM